MNETGGLLGRQVELRILDDQSNADRVVSDYEPLITQDEVDLVFGPFSTRLVVPAAQVAQEYGMLFVEPAGAAAEVFEQGFDNLFYAAPAVADDHYNHLADYILAMPEDERPQTAAYAAMDDPFAQGTAYGLETSWRRPASRRWSTRSTRPTPPTSRHRRADRRPQAEVLVGGTQYQDAVNLVVALQQLGYQPELAAFSTAPTNPEFPAAIGGKTEGIVSPTGYTPEAPYPTNDEFVERYTAQFGTPPAEDEANAYTTGQVVAAAVEAVGCAEPGRVPAAARRLAARERGRDRGRPAELGRPGPAAERPPDPAVRRRRDPDRAAGGGRGGRVHRPEARVVRRRAMRSDMATGALFVQSLVLGILLGGLYALLAAGLTLYFGVMRVVMIAHSAFLILAAYLAWYFHQRFGIDPLLSLVVTVPLFFVDRRRDPAAADLPAAPGDPDDDVGAADVRDGAGHRGPARVRLHRHPAADPARLQRREHRGVRRAHRGRQADRVRAGGRCRCSRCTCCCADAFGQALRATIQHPEAARLVGIDTDRVAGYGFGLGLATAAVGGAALALDSTIYPSLHWHWIGPLMAIIVVGGLGSIPGAAIAAMVLGVVQSLLQVPLGHDVGADGVLPRPVRHPDGAPAGILRRSPCATLLPRPGTPRPSAAAAAAARWSSGRRPGRPRRGRAVVPVSGARTRTSCPRRRAHELRGAGDVVELRRRVHRLHVPRPRRLVRPRRVRHRRCSSSGPASNPGSPLAGAA